MNSSYYLPVSTSNPMAARRSEHSRVPLPGKCIRSIFLGVLGSLRETSLPRSNNAGSKRLRVPLRKSSVFYGIFVAKILFPIRECGRRKSHDFRYDSRNLTICLGGLCGLRVLHRSKSDGGSADAACSVKRAGDKSSSNLSILSNNPIPPLLPYPIRRSIACG